MPNTTMSSKSHKGLHLSTPLPIEEMVHSIGRNIDPFGMFTSLINAQLAWLSHPAELLRATSALGDDLIALQTHLIHRSLGQPSEDVVTPHGDDVRFAEPVWSERATWDIIKELYLAITHRTQDMYFSTPGLSDEERRKSAFWARVWINAMAPTNNFFTNPVAMHKFAETKGASLQAGFKNLMRDIKAKNILMVEPDAFTVGKDVAYTPGKVVFQNKMFELLHYTATTEKVQKVPLLIVPPWINKYYILDLNQRNSMIKYLVDQGFSVFIVSWKNPTPDMADTSFEHYLIDGVKTAVETVAEFCKVPKIHLAGYCIGGTLVSTYMAWANAHYGAEKVPVLDWTLFTTLTDFREPGDISVFIDEHIIDHLEESMAKKGYLDGSEMASSFRLLRSNSLVWNYWVHSYLYGENLPPMDVLFWNMDCTRMPYAMHAYYLREMYLNNNLAKPGHIRLAGQAIDLNHIEQPLYAVTAQDDHIAPWQECYRIRKAMNAKTPVEFVLSTSGHILGIINPPTNPPKRSFWAGQPEHHELATHWQARTEKQAGTWWTHWTAWLKQRDPDEVKAYPTSSKAFPALSDAPGTYVMEK